MDKIIELLKDVVAALEKFIAAVEEEQAVVEEPAEEPIEEPIEEPVVEESVVEEPVIEEPVIEEPVVEEPVVETPIAEPVDESGDESTPVAEDPVEVVEPESIVEASAPTNIDWIVDEILEGKWGSGAKRKENLEAAGYDYDIMQNRVNEILNVVQEVLDRKWGNNDERKQKLEEAGYVYEVIQNQINRQLQKTIEEEEKKLKGSYPNELPTTKLVKTNSEVIADAIKWATWIAGDNNFHYGYSNADKTVNAHHNGCYFCGTNKSQKKGMLMPEHTYCCNPFIGAAWAHGGCVPQALKLCQNNKSWAYDKDKGYAVSSLFDNLGHPAKSTLKAGDVLCMNTHVAMYIGNGKLVEAGSGDDNVKNSTKWNNSIHVANLTDKRYNSFLRVHRYNGSVNTDTPIRHGEVSKRVALWQAFLDWYFDGKVGSADGIYGDNTLKWTRQFQEEQIGKGEGDGIIGPKTLEAAKNFQK